tara:strand:+ start:56 stop:271 length:216 start_codon:yes stop_codon:yes gene_type:complete
MQTYYTLFVRDEDGTWHDEFGGRLVDCREEFLETYYDTKTKDKKILSNDGTLPGLAANYARLGQPLRNFKP